MLKFKNPKKLGVLMILISLFCTVPNYSVFANNNLITITSQPKDISVKLGEKAKASIAATGTNLGYKWQFRYKGQSNWNDWGIGSNFTSAVGSKEYWNGLTFRCIVSDSKGNSVTSLEKTLTVIKPEIAITSQPKDISVKIGEKAKASIAATGTNLSYKWQFRYKGQSNWNDWGIGSSFTSAVGSKEYWNGLTFRCVITDSSGNTTVSQERYLYVIKNEDWELPIM